MWKKSNVPRRQLILHVCRVCLRACVSVLLYILPIKRLWFLEKRESSISESSTRCCDIQSLWRGKRVIVGVEETNPGKKSLDSQGGDHRSLTHALWYLTDMIAWLQYCWHRYSFGSRWLSVFLFQILKAAFCRFWPVSDPRVSKLTKWELQLIIVETNHLVTAE